MHFEDLNVWKRSSQLSVEIIKQFASCNDDCFKTQITRVCLSVPSHIAEGFERGTVQDCNTFFLLAKGACAELQTLIYIGTELGYIEKAQNINWKQEALKLSKMLSTLISSRSQ